MVEMFISRVDTGPRRVTHYDRRFQIGSFETNIGRRNEYFIEPVQVCVSLLDVVEWAKTACYPVPPREVFVKTQRVDSSLETTEFRTTGHFFVIGNLTVYDVAYDYLISCSIVSLEG